MKEFIENMLHQPMRLAKYADIEKLPLTLQANYDFFILELQTGRCLLARSKEEIGMAELRKHHRRLEILTGIPCVLYLTNMSQYSKEKMLEEGIPFVWEGKMVYMPFLGLWLKTGEAREIKRCSAISFLTQKLLLVAMYEQWKDVSVTQAAAKLNVSKMSVSRCFDEIESMNIPVLEKKGRFRTISCRKDKKKQWEELKPFMRNPVIREFYLEEDISAQLMKSGMSALSEFSMLSDNAYPTCAILKSQLKDYSIKDRKQVPKGETPKCIVQELGYIIPFKDGGTIDPLTTLMSMDEEAQDPRVDQAINQMLEEYVW
jgi:hypothetical protein